MNVKRWLREHSLRLLAIRDTPEAIAGGVAIGFFFGFTPLFGLKTVLAIAVAWVTRSNIIAAVLAGTLHDLVLPVMPFIWRLEYSLGYWMMNQEWPRRLSRGTLRPHSVRDWTTFLTVGKPWLLGSILLGAPLSVLCYFVTKYSLARYRRKHPHPPAEDSKKLTEGIPD